MTTNDTGLGKLTAHDLATLRRIVLAVIDDGDVESGTEWYLYESSHSDHDEAGINEQRLRFCDAVQQRIIAEGAPAVVRDINQQRKAEGSRG